MSLLTLTGAEVEGPGVAMEVQRNSKSAKAQGQSAQQQATPGAPLTTTKPRRSRFLLRGESIVASVGVALAVILLGAMGASAWWLGRTQSDASQLARVQQLHTV